MWPNEECYWWASVQGGSGSYTYDWYVDGAWQSNAQELYYTNPGSGFTVELSVSDANGARASDFRYIAVSSSEGTCPL